SKGGISGLKVIFFFPLLPLGAIFGGVVDFFLCKRGGEAGKQGFSANEKKAWRKICCGFFFQCGCNGHGAWIRNLSLMNGNIQPQSIIEEIDVSANAPWDDTSFIDIQIPIGPKDIVAQKHREKHFFTHANSEHICFYTDGSLLEGKAGTGIYASRADEMVHESKYYLGTEAEVFDAELYGIMKAADIATHITKDEDITDVWIFCDNQSAVRRMSDKRPIPGQEYILKTHTSAEILKSRGITVHIHWVPGHVQVQGNEKADALAKQGTEGKRLPRDATTSLTYL